ncbi:MAG TPA: response regulator [Terriglobales bacterium]|nr:response regulator [Terriglobales bacterium]
MEHLGRSGPFPFRILLVDDNPDLASLYADLLTARGYEVHVAHGGFEALANLRQSIPDLVVTDLAMPGTSGVELLSVLRRRFPQLPLVAISGSDEVRTEVLDADIFLRRCSASQEYFFEQVAHLLRAGVRRRLMRPAPLPWMPRNAAAHKRVTCGECLRSFRLPPGAVTVKTPPGVHSCVCVYCGTPQGFIVGEAEAA